MKGSGSLLTHKKTNCGFVIHHPTVTPSRLTGKNCQTALQHQARLMPGLYVANHHQPGVLPFFAVQADGAIETTVDVPPNTDLEYSAAFNLFSPNNSQLLFYDGQIGIFKRRRLSHPNH